MSIISDILQFNREFVQRKEYEAYRTDRLPNKRLVIVTCMDTRLVELLPRAMNIRNGDVKIIKNAGAIVSHPFGSVMRSILVAVYDLGVGDVAVVGHHDCGMTGLSCDRLVAKMRERGVSPDTFAMLGNAGIDLQRWLVGFARPEDGVRQSVRMIRNHPLLPRNVAVHGLLIDPATGKLDVVEGATITSQSSGSA